MTRHAIVTGGSRGIGFAIAQRLLQDGMRVSIVGRDRDALERAAAMLGSGVCHETADVTDYAAVSGAFNSLAQRQGGLAVLVNNAGAAESAPFDRTDENLWQRMIDVNLTSTYHCLRAATPMLLMTPDARVVNVASTAGQTGYPYVAAYCAAKHGVIGLTRALAREWAGKSITVNAVCPGFTDTDLVRESVERIRRSTGRSAEQALASLTSSNPQRRLIDPAEVANAVSWLCDWRSGGITGQSISVSGGEVL
jgi:NAD(P)-dependent dehydrogenase (short-subunit alcohol dehydrogenase family)